MKNIIWIYKKNKLCWTQKSCIRKNKTLIEKLKKVNNLKEKSNKKTYLGEKV